MRQYPNFKMPNGSYTEMSLSGRLKILTNALKDFEAEKQIAVAKWLEGVISGQSLSNEERERVVKAVNDYISSLEKSDYGKGINALLDFLRDLQERNLDSPLLTPL